MATTLSSQVSAFLQKGESFLKKQEGISGPNLTNCSLQVDEDGFFLLWSFSENELNVLECTHIKEVTNGIPLKDTKALCLISNGDSDLPSRVLTIYYGIEIGSLSVVQFVAATREQTEKWVVALNRIVNHVDSHFLSPLAILKKQWKRLCYSLTAKGKIPVRKLVKHFCHEKNEKVILQRLKNCGFSYSKNQEISPSDFTFNIYKEIYRNLCTRKDLDEVFAEVVKGKAEHIELSDFIAWLNDNQRDPRSNEILSPPFDDKRARAIVAKYESDPQNCEADRMSKQGFFDYLASDDNSLIYREHISLYHDMDQPLNNYFINSSHNTYLTGFQWKGKSSVDIYRHALLAGYRCIELDCWDGKGEYHGEPIITHGKAMCTDVVFKNVLVAIRDAAFVTSDYPVVLSFETHCSKPLQLKMAKYCEEVFGDLLLGKPMEGHPLDPGLPLPSPNSLKGKILIKNKRLDPEVEKAQLENLSRNKDYVLDDEPEEAHPELEATKQEAGDELPAENNECESRDAQVDQSQVETLKSRSSLKKNQSFPDEDEPEFPNYEYTKTSATNIHPYLSSLVNYCQSVKFPGFKKVEEDTSQKRCFQMSSFSESVGLSYLKSNAIDFVVYNRSQLSRIYPKGARFDSSNYMPQIFWNAGCQMVSLNVQTNDIGVQMNNEKFLFNGRSGYLLKPDVLVKKNKNFDPFAESSIDGVIAAQCGVKVISSQFLFDRSISSTVQVQMYGLPTDTIRKEFRTGAIPNNALNPIYKENNEFLFRKIICPDLALLRFVLTDDSKQLSAQRVIPLSSLQTGYRYVTLKSMSGIPLDSAMIFVKISLGSYVPESLLEIASALENPKAHYESKEAQHSKQLECYGVDVVDDVDNGNSSSGSSSATELPVVESLRRNGKEGSTKSAKSKSSAKSREKAPLSTKASVSSSMQRSIYSKPEEKNAYNEVLKESQVTLEELQKHPMYLKTIESFKRDYAKRSKKLSKRSTASEGELRGGQCCGLTRIFVKRRKNENNSNNLKQQVDENLLCDPSFDPVSLERKKTALLNALESIHEDAQEALRKIQEKEMNDVTQRQTKKWMESAKSINKDKSIPSSERSRRVRDMKSQDIKSFTEVRQTMKNRHMKQSERLEAALQEKYENMKSEIEENFTE